MPELIDPDPPPALPDPPGEAPSEGVLPRFPPFNRRRGDPSPTGPTETLPPPLADLSGSAPLTGSSKGSTDLPNPEAPPKQRPTVPIKDLTDAVVKMADIVFVLGGAAFGTAWDRARGHDHDPKRWTPTPSERELVLQPTARIVGRHVSGDVAVADAVDGALVAAGLGHFAARAIYDLEILPDEKGPENRGS